MRLCSGCIQFSSRTPLSRIIFLKLRVFHQIHIFSNFYGAGRLITVWWDFRFWRRWKLRLHLIPYDLVCVVSKISEEPATAIFFYLEDLDSMFSETLLPIYQTTRHLIAEAVILIAQYRCHKSPKRVASWARSPQPTPSFTPSLRCTSILILCSHLLQGLPVGSVPFTLSYQNFFFLNMGIITFGISNPLLIFWLSCVV
jgi:hypothetical protein